MDVDNCLFHPVALQDWEADIIWDDRDSTNEHVTTSSIPATSTFSYFLLPIISGKKSHSMEIVPNYDVETGEWEDYIIWDDGDAFKFRDLPAQINLNDPFLIVENALESRHPKSKRRFPPTRYPSGPFVGGNSVGMVTRFGNDVGQMRWQLDKFNLSNDRYYDLHRVGKSGRVRQMFNKNSVQHSLPAVKLQLPFFKRYMSKSDLRSFHRPQMKIVPGEQWKFTRIKNLKKKLKGGKTITEVLGTVKDITVKDNSSYALFEFCEEYPPIMSDGGMGSLVVNYYRKKDEKDAYLPRYSEGQNTVLEQVDASPFFAFGEIPPGQSMQALKNNLFIAPIFPHQLKHEDVLLIRYSGAKDGTKRLYLRSIPRAFTVGQIFPTYEVPPPQSRKVKAFIRDRLKVVALRYFKRHGRHTRYPINKIINAYHRYHEQSIRKHLKDQCELQRSSKNNLWWLVLKKGIPLPSEEELNKVVTPEMVCAFESMRVGQQRLADFGYGTVSTFK
jgi:hypothetical protein